MSKSIMVFIEQNEGNIANVSLELISKASALAEQLGTSVTAAALGSGLKNKLVTLGSYGVSKVYYINDKKLHHFTAVPYSKIVSGIIKEHKPQIVLFGATTTGRALAPRVASALKCGLTADCTGLEIGDFDSKKKIYCNKLIQIRPAFGGNIIATIVSPESDPSMATVREGVMALPEHIGSEKAEIVEKKNPLCETDYMTEVLEVIHREKLVNLKSANIIVSAGMGAADPASLELVRQLADTLGGELGCSRPMVDSGVLGKEHQVGQTGITVRPNLYIACGISGQIQHRAGMSQSKRILAINKDPHAPIFSIANYGIIGELNDIIPLLIKAYRAKV
ncbi:MAG: electron transfer flavoprotein subunit alpha/FixB family protein [Spirochaetaceae bacterium]|nr:electron transfer flavoprotein subunit alpha/FixB family protein [Spirochaetaceae bacterium]